MDARGGGNIRPRGRGTHALDIRTEERGGCEWEGGKGGGPARSRVQPNLF